MSDIKLTSSTATDLQGRAANLEVPSEALNERLPARSPRSRTPKETPHA